VQDTKNAQKFASVLSQGYTLVKEGEDKMTIEVAQTDGQCQFPLVKSTDGGSWYFDTAAGKEEIITVI